jgi:hypothetical protein
MSGREGAERSHRVERAIFSVRCTYRKVEKVELILIRSREVDLIRLKTSLFFLLHDSTPSLNFHIAA